MNKFLRVSVDWESLPGYVCRTCGDAARKHPETMFIWGCLKCGMTTASVSVYFRDVSEPVGWIEPATDAAKGER